MRLKLQYVVGEVSTAPPVGPVLAQYEVDLLSTIKYINEISSIYNKGTPLYLYFKVENGVMLSQEGPYPRFKSMFSSVSFLNDKTGQLQIFLGDIYNLFCCICFYKKDIISYRLAKNFFGTLYSYYDFIIVF